MSFIADLPHARSASFSYNCNALHEHGIVVVISDDNVFYIRDGVEQTDATHHVSLPVLFDHVATNVEVATRNGFINFEWCKLKLLQLRRVDINLVDLALATERNDVGDTWNCAELPVDDPVLYRE